MREFGSCDRQITDSERETLERRRQIRRNTDWRFFEPGSPIDPFEKFSVVKSIREVLFNHKYTISKGTG